MASKIPNHPYRMFFWITKCVRLIPERLIPIEVGLYHRLLFTHTTTVYWRHDPSLHKNDSSNDLTQRHDSVPVP